MRPRYSERKGGRGGSGPVRCGAETLCPAPGPAGPCGCEVLALLSHVGSVGLGRASSCSSPWSTGSEEVGAARPSPAWAPDPGRAWGETGPEPQGKLSAGPGTHSPTGAGLGPKATLSLAAARAGRVVGARRDLGPGGRPGLRPPLAEERVQGVRPRAGRKRVRAAPWRFLLFLLFGAGARRVTVPPALGSAPVTSPGKSSGEEDLSGGEERVPQRGDRAAGAGPGPAPAAFVQGRTPGRPGSCVDPKYFLSRLATLPWTLNPAK
ncbi:uncharacterized protein LOC114679653 [Macaca mulatta]